MNRRRFFARASGWGVGIALQRASAAAPRQPIQYYFDSRQLFRMGVSSSSFRNYFPATRNQDFTLPGPTLSLLDFPRMVAERYEIHHLEFDSAHFSSQEPEYLLELRRQLLRSGSYLLNVFLTLPELETEGGLSSTVPAIRENAVATVREWMAVARRLDARAVTPNPGLINPADLTPTIKSYRLLSAYGWRLGVRVLMENSTSVTTSEILTVVRSVPGSIRILPDFANFPAAEDREASLAELFPQSFTLCHADGVTFDRFGNETSFDFARCVEIAERSRFRGIYMIAYRGTGSPYVGVQNVINELIRDL